MPSIIVYKDINIMDIIAGETNFRNSKVVNFLVNKFSINFTSFYYSLSIISYIVTICQEKFYLYDKQLKINKKSY
ncbi:hypothetical protein QSC_1465 [Clostridioides difficile P23]|nr:hypothetical protein QSC_1465 [Clostridioides difficile P23]